MKPGGVIAVAASGLMQEMQGSFPDHLRLWWEPSLCCLHSADWWRRQWDRNGIVEGQLADAMPHGWQAWLEWQRRNYPQNRTEIEAVEADGGRYLGHIRIIGHRRPEVHLDEPIVSIAAQYTKKSLLRFNEPPGQA